MNLHVRTLARIKARSKKNFATGVSKNLMLFFAKQNNVPMIGSLKASVIGFVTEIMNMYFFETP